MLKIKNKKIISQVAKTTYRAHKKRNMLTIFAVMLTTFLISVIIAVGVSYWNTVSQRRIRMNGMDYDIELSEPKEEQIKKVRSMEQVTYAGLAVKCAIVESCEGVKLDKMKLYWLDQTCWEKQTIPALERYEGSYPEKENEIMLSSATLKAMGISDPEQGMHLALRYYTLTEDSESDFLEKEFVLCGWYTDYSGSDRGYVSQLFYEETGVKPTDLTQGALKISLKNPLYTEEDIIALQEPLKLDRNQYIDADIDTISNFVKVMIGLLAMLIMVFASGYLFIYNTLYLSISKDIRYYGQLKTLGMTSVQLKGIVYRQMFWNAAAGIPAGLAAAVVTAEMMIPRTLNAVNPSISVGEVSRGPAWGYAAAVLFAFGTNFISSRKPAKMAAECSPVEAMKYIGGVKENRKTHFGEEGGFGSVIIRNMFRDKKQFFVILSSFVIAVSLFLVIHVVIEENDAKRILNTIYTYDLELKNITTLEDDERPVFTVGDIQELKEISGVKSVRAVTSTVAVVPYQEEVFGTYYRELYKTRFSPGDYEADMELYKTNPENSMFTTRFVGVDEEGFSLLNHQLGGALDKEQFESGEIAAVSKSFTEGGHGIAGKEVKFRLPGGLSPDVMHTVKIAAVGDGSCDPAYFAGGYTPVIIVSETYARKLMGETFVELVDVSFAEPFDGKTENEVKELFSDRKDITIESKGDRYHGMKNSETQVKILGNSIGIIIAVLAALNYINMIAAGIQNRLMEFAIMESVGMTTWQAKKMLVFEGMGYAVFSLALSLGIGIPVSHVVFDGMNLYRVSYSVPWIKNVILFLIIIVICVGTPVIIYGKAQKASIVERLRAGED